MSPDVPVTLVREGLVLLGTVGSPLFGVLLVVGFVVGVLQATTQINDSAVGFLPRAAGAILACWLLGPWMVERLALFFTRAVEQMGGRPF
ncbi:MAG: flagellar biosynthetic protein FliQ [Myxococcales bacterium]